MIIEFLLARIRLGYGWNKFMISEKIGLIHKTASIAEKLSMKTAFE